MKFPKFLRDVAKTARAQGWVVEQTHNNHVKFKAPSGALVIASGTPSDVRTIYNLTARLRRGGLNI